MTKGVTYRTKNLTKWNENRGGEIAFEPHSEMRWKTVPTNGGG